MKDVVISEICNIYKVELKRFLVLSLYQVHITNKVSKNHLFLFINLIRSKFKFFWENLPIL